MNPNNYDYLFRVILIGNAASGKSSILMRFAENEYKGVYQATIGLDFKIKIFEIDGESVKLQIWDTAGQETFRTVTCSYYKGAAGVIIFYDVTDKHSFKAIEGWLEELDKYGSATVARLLVGNKTDLEGQRQVSYAEGKALADRLGLKFLETSAKLSTNVSESFSEIARLMIANAKTTAGANTGYKKGDIALAANNSQNSEGCSC